MTHRRLSNLLLLLAGIPAAAGIVLYAQAQDRFTLKAANGIALSEFRGYDEWQMIAPSQTEKDFGCGTSKTGCMKAILGNPPMVKAYRDGIPANGSAVPDGAALAKVEWLKARDTASPYGVTVPGTLTEVSFMLKDSKRFPETNGWGYATFQYDAPTNTFKPSTANPQFPRVCHQCHTAGAAKRDFVFTHRPNR